MTAQDTPEPSQRKCGLIHEGQFCTRPATIKIPAGPDAWAYLCDFHAGQIVGIAIRWEEKEQQ
jgi:hypothetical protein